MKIAAAHALASAVTNLSADKILPNPLDSSTAVIVANAVEKTAIAENELL